MPEMAEQAERAENQSELLGTEQFPRYMLL